MTSPANHHVSNQIGTKTIPHHCSRDTIQETTVTNIPFSPTFVPAPAPQNQEVGTIALHPDSEESKKITELLNIHRGK